MKKRLINILLGLMTLALIFGALGACDQSVAPLDPEGPYTPGPDAATGTLSGGSKESSILPVFDINNLPPISAWNDFGEIVPIPNPFYKADGTEITSETQWPERREEIAKIVQNYLTGYYPPPPSKVEISGAGATGAGIVNIIIEANGRVRSYDATITLPVNAPNGQPVSATNKCPAIIGISGANTAIYTDNGYAVISWTHDTANGNTIVRQLWDDWPTPLTRPSALVQESWRAGRLIDAIELGAGGGLIDPAKMLVTGASRSGKETLHIAAFAESMKGTKFAVASPSVTCSGGTPIERIVSYTATKRLHYFLDLGDYSGGTPLIRLVPPGTAGATELPVNNGIQGNIHGREEVPEWYGPMFQQFAHLHPEWRINYFHEAKDYGIAGTSPFDAHFLMSLVAPRGLLIEDVFADNWSHPEGAYIGYLATKEVYDFLGNGAENNIGFRVYYAGHSQPTRANYDIIDFANQYFNRQNSSLGYGRLSGEDVVAEAASVNIFQDADPKQGGEHIITWFDPRTRDPAGYMEYTKLNWASPKKPAGSSVAAQVKAYFDAHPGETLQNSIFLAEE